MRRSDPLAEALTAQNWTQGRVIAEVDGKLFILSHWSIKANNADLLQTTWMPLEDAVAAWTIPLRFTIRMKLMYWRRKLFGRPVWNAAGHAR